MGWVQSAKWSPSGAQLGFVGQDSTVCVADVTSGTPKVEVVKYKDLPFRDLVFVSEDQIIAVGHDCTPVSFAKKGSWQFVKKVDEGGAASAADKKNTAFDVFKNKVDKGQESIQETSLTTKHQNTITCVVPYKKNANVVAQYSTTALDGQLIIWDAK